jgi:hypothetical protein
MTHDDLIRTGTQTPVAGQTPATAPAPAISPLVSSAVSEALDVENFIDIYQTVAEWIRFADAKAAVVLTVNGVQVGLLIPTLKVFLDSRVQHSGSLWPNLVLTIFGLAAVSMLISAARAFLCILPFTRRGQHPAMQLCKHFHPASISQNFGLDQVKQFSQECAELSANHLRGEVAAGLLIDSHISASKYRQVTSAIRWLGISAVLSGFYFVLLQF